MKFRPFTLFVSIHQDFICRLHCGKKNKPLVFITVDYLIACS